MYQASDRSVRKYKQNLREGRPFRICLRTKEGSVDIRIGEDKQAMMLNKDTCEYDLPLGDGPYIVDLIEKDAPIPGLKVWWGVTLPTSGTEVPEEEVLVSGPNYDVIPPYEERDERPNAPPLPLGHFVGSERKPKAADSADFVATSPITQPTTQVGKRKEEKPEEKPVRASTALSLIAAYKSGSRNFRKYDDSLAEREDGVLVWKFKVWRQEDRHWRVIDTVTIALFTPEGIEFPPEGRQYRAVVSRRALLAPPII